MSEKKFWKISDFVEELNMHLDQSNTHINTIDGWFKRLEKEHLHYVNRTLDTNEKVYDELDLKIAVFIKKRREEKWSLTSIANDLPNFFELRPFPMKEETPAPHVDNLETLKRQVTEEVKKAFEEIAVTKVEELKSHYEKLLNTLPQPLSPEERREERFQEIVIRKRVEIQLEKEANEAWSQLPETERMKKARFFRKEVDFEKKGQFIRDYVDKHFENRLREKMDLKQ
jgi:hypothetical protein